MKPAKKITILNALLILTALVMFVIGYQYRNPAPSVTGIGFILIAWIFNTLNQQKEEQKDHSE